MQRIVMHLDMDSFYASVEALRRPELKGKPLAICVFSGRTKDSGAVASASYAARAMGIRAGLSIREARAKAAAWTKAAEGKGDRSPSDAQGSGEVAFLPYDIEYYRQVSDRIVGILEEEADAVQQAGIDEAYMDVTDRAGGDWDRAREMALRIKRRVLEEEGLTCSIGIGPNKFVAKMASKRQKPDGLTVVRTADVGGFLAGLPVGKLHGIGGKTAGTLEGMGIRTAAELAAAPEKGLEEAFGERKSRLLREKALGLEDSPVERRLPKQFSRLGTLKEDTDDTEAIMEKLEALSGSLKKRLDGKGISFRTVTFIGIDDRLGLRTRSETMGETADVAKALPVLRKLVSSFVSEFRGRKLRRVGLTLSNLTYGTESRDVKGQKSLKEF
jgi:DNA polymerase IV (DinB-like DNA polymerase)